MTLTTVALAIAAEETGTVYVNQLIVLNSFLFSTGERSARSMTMSSKRLLARSIQRYRKQNNVSEST